MNLSRKNKKNVNKKSSKKLTTKPSKKSSKKSIIKSRKKSIIKSRKKITRKLRKKYNKNKLKFNKINGGTQRSRTLVSRLITPMLSRRTNRIGQSNGPVIVPAFGYRTPVGIPIQLDVASAVNEATAVETLLNDTLVQTIIHINTIHEDMREVYNMLENYEREQESPKLENLYLLNQCLNRANDDWVYAWTSGFNIKELVNSVINKNLVNQNYAHTASNMADDAHLQLLNLQNNMLNMINKIKHLFNNFNVYNIPKNYEAWRERLSLVMTETSKSVYDLYNTLNKLKNLYEHVDTMIRTQRVPASGIEVPMGLPVSQ